MSSSVDSSSAGGKNARHPQTETTDMLDAIVADIIRAEEDGEAIDREALITEYPEFAVELRQFFADRDAMGRLMQPTQHKETEALPTKIRYFGNYELLEEVARGGMGVVYRGRQTTLDRIVAVKMIKSGQLASEEDIRRFETEAQAAANLQHPNIVSVYEVGVFQGQHYFSMEYVDGQNLAEMIRENPLPARRAARYVRDIAAAVHYAHQQGTLHRDLKPSNVLIDQRDQVRITDFGLAVRVEGNGELTRTGQILGTPSYISPEQALGKRGLVGPASDIYSLGVVLYELLTGRPPFRAETAVLTVRQVVEVEPVPLRRLNPSAPRELETICAKCLEKEPSQRFYRTAGELASEVDRFLRGDPILARPLGPLHRTWRRVKRYPAAAALAVMILLALFGTPWMVMTQIRLREDAARTRVERVLSTSPAKVVRQLTLLHDFPSYSRDYLSDVFDDPTRSERERLRAAYGLALLNGTHMDYVVRSIMTADESEASNIGHVLKQNPTAAIRRLLEMGRVPRVHPVKARIAVTLLCLGEPQLAEAMSRPREDPIERTVLIDVLGSWRVGVGDLADQLPSYVGRPDLCSAVCLGIGSISWDELTGSDRRKLMRNVTGLFQKASSGSVRSAAEWTLRNWKQSLPLVGNPAEGKGWYSTGLGLTMIRVPPISVQKGHTEHAGLPLALYVSSREISLRMFRQFLNDKDPRVVKPPDAARWAGVRGIPPAAVVGDAPPLAADEETPARFANLRDAMLFCNWLSMKAGLPENEWCYVVETGEGGRQRIVLAPDCARRSGYRLPTGGEWLHACQAGSRKYYCFGNDATYLIKYVVGPYHHALPCGSKLPNAWGMFDMHGNVWEWCHRRLETSSTDAHGYPDSSLRGGSFRTPAGQNAYARRRARGPESQTYERTGFRVVRRLPPRPGAIWDGVKAPHPTGIAHAGIRASIDNLARDALIDANIPGMTVAATQHGRLVYWRGIGYANWETKRPMSENMRAPIGSSSKVLVTLAMLKLLGSQPHLSLNSRVYGDRGILSDSDYSEAYRQGTRRHDPLIGVAIGRRNRVLAWYSDGQFTVGTSDDLQRYAGPSKFSLPEGKRMADVVGIARGGKDNCVYSWYRDKTYHVGTPDDLDAYSAGSQQEYNLKRTDRILGIAMAADASRFYTYYHDGRVFSGDSPSNLTNRWEKTFTVPEDPERRYDIVGVARSANEVQIAWYNDNKLSKGSSTELAFGSGLQRSAQRLVADPRDPWNKAYEDIEIGHLLSHTSGLTRSGDWRQAAMKYEKPLVRELVPYKFSNLYVLSTRPLLFRPGEASRYSNHGIGLVGHLIEQISGQDWYGYLRENILVPASAEAIVPIGRDHDPLEASDSRSHTIRQDETVVTRPVLFRSISGSAAGSLKAAAVDLCRVMVATDQLDNHPDVLDQKTLRIMESRPFPEIAENRALGWQVACNNVTCSGRKLWHNGSHPRGGSYMAKYQGYSYGGQTISAISVAIVVNRGNPNTAKLRKLADDIALQISRCETADDFDLFRPIVR